MSSELLEKWYETKKVIHNLEKTLENLKAILGKEMNMKNVDEISSDRFVLKRRRISKLIVTKSSIPADLWAKYAVRSCFDSYHLTLRPRAKAKRSHRKKSG